jgi:hypothetical protein
MKALTLWRPWSDAIVRGPKAIENRGWWHRSIVGETIAIHAGTRFDADGFVAMRRLWRGAPDSTVSPQGIVGVARVCGVIAPGEGEDGHECPVVLAGIPGVHVDADARWWSGRSFGWILDQRVAIEPVPCRGAQGLWNVPLPIEAVVRDRVRARVAERAGPRA